MSELANNVIATGFIFLTAAYLLACLAFNPKTKSIDGVPKAVVYGIVLIFIAGVLSVISGALIGVWE